MQSQNFEFLRNAWPELASLAGFAERYTHADPQSAQTKLRNFAERCVDIVYSELSLPRTPMSKFMELLSNDAFEAVTPKVVVDKLHAIRIHGNKAAHGDKVSEQSAQWLLKEAFDLGRWLFVTYSQGDAATIKAFEQPKPPQSAKADYKHERKALLEQYAKQEAHMQVLLAELEAEREKATQWQRTEEELTQLKQQATHNGQQAVNELHFDEAATRKQLINLQLAQAGWEIGNTHQITLEEKVLYQPTITGDGYADYVLWDDNGKPLAVVEAKKAAVDAEKGRHQAKHYADGLEKMHGQRPVIFYTNGHDIWIWDDHPEQNYPPRKLYGFYSKSSLQYQVRQRTERKPLNSVSAKADILGDRLYQHEALKRISERFETKQRKALAVQATGTGKTRLSIALTDVCMKAGWVKRVLFVCDRRELRKQAKNAYSEYLSAPITVLTSKSVQDSHNRIFIATYPAMIRLFEKFDPGFFDLIIADESHRSIYNIYGDLFRYFDALQVGLTATPVEMVSRSTCQLFGCDFKEPTCNYSLETAIEEGYLVPYQVVKHTTKFLRDGIKGHALSAEEIAELEDKGIDPNSLDFDAQEIDRAIYNKDTNRKILQNLMENGIRQADGQTLGKTIVFARNHKHAKLLETLFDELYPQYGGKFCHVIDNYDPRAEALIDDFKGLGNNDQLTIAISVDMLDTGIDVPEIVNLVFARPVKSPVKFWQMIGRGTRLCLNLFGAGKHKSHFQIFDHWGVVEYHGLKPREVSISQPKAMMQRLFEARLLLAKTALHHAEPDFFDCVAQWLHKTVNSLDDNTLAVRDKWKVKRQMSDLETIRQFNANTVILQETEIAPLMQWLDIRGHSDAYQWDLLISQIQQQKLKKSNADDLTGEAINQLWQLQMNLNQVKAKASTIKQCREPAWWQAASLDELEQLRIELRSIMQYREKGTGPRPEAPTVDITDSDEIHEQQSTYLKAVDMASYRLKVEQALTALFEQNPILQKIRNGAPVTLAELDNLNALIHTQHPDIDLNILKGFYDTAAPMEQILRSIVGMNADKVNQHFADFIQHYPSLNARQVQFLSLLKRQIAQSGAIEINSLYQMPFAALGGLDQVFTNEQQIDDLLAIVTSFGKQPSLSALMGDQ
ncbi:MAG: DEAD/DEAH box helicase family protein [Methylobacter sp.]|nr:DEAD/DEAH box helicase family protein [Methylobacter sp.]MDP2098179.1 DEAD/DEAH box helicase family protein [Methylobacter sp.]MDP2426941.1 DEAD/DEAH box helicase family protein [Methylobacter sp.]MDP3054318.1 DEAD/DEAH box helicase family protein [Methylobacter sp.]MDP3364055.1 DEAD/DEAH box helicase family protein [Methylobacter sp.]